MFGIPTGFVLFDDVHTAGLFLLPENVVKMSNSTTNKQNSLAPKCANLRLSSIEVTQLKNLLFNAIWYNDECNFGHHNRVIEVLMEARTEKNNEELNHAVQLLSKVGYMSHLINSIHDRLKDLEGICDELNIP